MPRISLIIPTYNYGRFIRKAIDTSLAQDNVSTELIVIDDGSTDDTPAILASYKDRIRAFHQKHRGAPIARNLGLSKANGEFVLFLDADDWLMPGALSSRLEFLTANPHCGWVYGPAYIWDESGCDVTAAFRDRPFAYRHRRQGRILPHLLLGELLQPATVMLRRQLVLDAGGFHPNLPSLQDHELWLRIADRSPVGFIQRTNVVVVTHEGSISRSKGDGYQTLFQILQDAQHQYPDTIRTLAQDWQQRYAWVLAERARHLAKQRDYAGSFALICEAIRREPAKLRHYLGLFRVLISTVRTIF